MKAGILHIKRNPRKLTSHQKQWRPEGSEIAYSKNWKGGKKTVNQESYIQQNCAFKNEGGKKILPDKQKLREFVASRVTLQVIKFIGLKLSKPR